MILRVWKGWTQRDRADAYETYMREVALPGYADVAGNRAVYLTRRPAAGDRTEFGMVTVWDSMEAVKAFAGDNPDRAVFYDRDDEFLVERDWDVAHYEIFAATGDG